MTLKHGITHYKTRLRPFYNKLREFQKREELNLPRVAAPGGIDFIWVEEALYRFSGSLTVVTVYE
tara:strand:+ start:4293 stop:4487 length:195 start_codon:yes stop_codon:yes gene_type:complete